MTTPILLSDRTTLVIKYAMPALILFSFTTMRFNNGGDFFWSIWLLIGLFFWYKKILPLRTILFLEDHLIISNGLKMDKVYTFNIQELKFALVPGYISHINFKQETIFGSEVSFIIRRSPWYSWKYSKDVIDTLTKLQLTVDSPENNNIR
jgi:hypothetical protein